MPSSCVWAVLSALGAGSENEKGGGAGGGEQCECVSSEVSHLSVLSSYAQKVKRVASLDLVQMALAQPAASPS